jgi:hypothetical protein
LSTPEPSDAELLAFAESLLKNVGEGLRERRVLEEAIQLHRATWLTLYAAGSSLKSITKSHPPPES